MSKKSPKWLRKQPPAGTGLKDRLRRLLGSILEAFWGPKSRLKPYLRQHVQNMQNCILAEARAQFSRFRGVQNRAKIAILAAFGGLLGAILALLGAILAHLGALGRHLGSSSGSWSPSCCQRCRNIAPTCAKTAHIRATIAQNDF